MSNEGSDKLRILVVAVPLLLYTYPGVAMILAHSHSPIYLGRYSQSLLVLNTANLAILVASIFFLFRRSFYLGQSCLIGYCFMSFAFAGNSDVAGLRFIELVLPLIRVTAAMAISMLAFIRLRREGRSCTRAFFALASALLVLGVCDGIVYAVLQSKTEHGSVLDGTFRDRYDLSTRGRRDVLFVGDSFVWGTGVGKEERFCSRAEIHWASIGDTKNVYCLGHVGTDLKGYARILQLIPRGVTPGAVYVFYYHNDFPAVDVAWERYTRFFESVSRSSKSFLLVRDLFVKAVQLDAHAYQQFLVDNHDRSEATYSLRWNLFLKQLGDVYDRAQRIAPGCVYLVILPVAVNFEPYPLAEADEEIRQAAAAMGYVVLNPIAFLLADGMVTADEYRSSPNDIHYNAKLNDAVARYLVFGSPGTCSPGARGH